jgi:hypothetical protein
MTNRDVPLKVSRAFRRLLDIEMAGDRERKRQTYCDIMMDLAVWLKLESYEQTPLGLDNRAPPECVLRYPLLLLMWERAHLAYLKYARFHTKKSA